MEQENKEKSKEENNLIFAVERANINPSPLNRLGKELLAEEIICLINDKELNEFLKKYGYKY